MTRVLLIEPNPDIMCINATALRMRHYDVLQAFSLAEADELLAANAPDMIVMETALPDGSGLDFCRNFRKRSRTPILFLSALSEGRDIVAGLRAGADDYITKPHDLGVLAERIEVRLRSEPSFRDGTERVQ